MAVIYLVRHGQAASRSRDYDSLSPLGREQSRVVGEALRRHLPDADGKPVAPRVISGAMARHRETAAECLSALGIEVDPEIDERWNEYDHHDIIVGHKPAYRSRTLMLADLARTGQPQRAFQEMFDAALARWVTAESGYRETWAVFSKRVRAALDDLAGTVGAVGAAGSASAVGSARPTGPAGPSETVLVFTSGGPIGAAAASLLGAGSGAGHATGADAGAGAGSGTGPGSAAELWLRLSRVTVNTGVTKATVGRRGATLISFNDHSHLDGELLTYR